MRKKLLVTYVILILMAVGIASFSFWSRGYSYINKQSENVYLMKAEILGDTFANTEIEEEKDYKNFVDDYSQKYKIRITLISNDGTVIADSSTNKQLENHKNREEVKGALLGKKVTVKRYSSTMRQMYIYSAVPAKTGGFTGVLRVSVPLSYLNGLNHNFYHSLVFSVVTCLFLAIIVAIYFTKLISKPIDDISRAANQISNGNYDIKIYTREKDQLGQLVHSFNIMTGNLKSSMKKLTRRNIELEAILSSMQSGVVAIDDSNSILFHNNSFSNIIELQESNLVSKSIYNVARNALIFEVIDLVREKHETVVREGSLSLKEDKIIRVTATRLVKETGRDLGVLIILENITQMKKLENMRRDFVSNVTHELKTPLTSIRGFIDTLKGGAIQDEVVAKRFLDIIDIEAERLHILIQDILLLSEIESKGDKETKDCDITHTISDVIELLQPKMTDKVYIIFDNNSNIRPFPCNPDRMKQLFINLLDNAIKYTEEGSVRIQCKEKQDKLFISISDTGIGIEEKYLDRIFERFYRVDKGRSRKMGGTGLGLSIVKHIVELYNGKINVYSTSGVGTTFEIWLPYGK
ncbi:two-component system histidine kinase PnpS [Anaeromicropila herbilytica]|uniref:histidine kinase n=1 Tax=Anaeromicropila herbilytica TaxID=2785025 RepID=A0A7R7IFN3_9FIRM|nr:ATP-binding protein [Anaeromicropila herbilytica]BCN32318.1 PAS domain-containing sensor histidine kinase [Anaeromicropila herbilytica]